MKKGIIIAVVALVVLFILCGGMIGGILYVVMKATQPPVDATDQFLALVAQGKTAEAYASAATALRQQQTEADFTAAVKRMGLTDYASASYSKRNVVNNEATLEGTIQTRTGGSIPVTVKLVKEGEQWRVLAITVPEAQVKVSETKRQVPPDAELAKLVTGTLLDFDQAVKAGDFQAFHGKVARKFQGQVSPEKFKEVFRAFIDQKIDLGEIKAIAPVFSEPPGLDQDGMLALAGFYPAKGRRITFKLRYDYEHPTWKLFGINVQVAPE